GDAPEAGQGRELVAPDGAVERESMYKPPRKPVPADGDGELHVASRHAEWRVSTARPRERRGTEEARNLVGDRRGAPESIDADEYNLGLRHLRLVRYPPHDVTEGHAGRTAVGHRGLDTQHLARIDRRFVLDRRLANGGPDAVAVEEVHTGTARDGLTPRSP